VIEIRETELPLGSVANFLVRVTVILEMTEILTNHLAVISTIIVAAKTRRLEVIE
jgi:hypothetical protein